MAYINAFTNHFRAVQEWGQRAQASIALDVLTFEMEVKCRGRYYNFHPQFVGRVQGRLLNLPALTPDTTGFIGWRPYRPVSYELSTHKLQFKKFADACGLRTPAQWNVDASAPPPDTDYILKRASGSFGYELAGPFRAHTVPPADPTVPGSGALFAEQFVRGRSMKVWYWGQRPFFAHLREPATVITDGQSTLRELIERRFRSANQDFDTHAERHVVQDCLAYQGLGLDDAPEEGRPVLVDYRYGRELRLGASNTRSDNDLPSLPPPVLEAVELAGAHFAAKLRETMPAPVAYALDAVVDADNQVWWLEANSNPVLPPEGYETMFADLFGV
jgi:hypothetical protein